ncbi:hypothetical protein [Parasediminibacterium sp. JCM 36343]|uniref:hypothetical protein n=1 Tax=Parasediminibacterium sp. JCM 36343 TaxID=3374279 RepID=UPI003978A845
MWLDKGRSQLDTGYWLTKFVHRSTQAGFEKTKDGTPCIDKTADNMGIAASRGDGKNFIFFFFAWL